MAINDMRYAVLTGDIVASTALTPEQLSDAMDALEQGCHDIGGWSDDCTVGFARRGGDGWQVAMSCHRFSFRATLYLKAVLRRMGDTLASRIAVAEGEGTLLPDHDPNKAHGPAFTESGRALEQMDRYALITHTSGGAIGAAYRLADVITAGWTTAQARALCEVLSPDRVTQAEVAERLGITRAAVQQALAAADYRAVQDAISLMESGK